MSADGTRSLPPAVENLLDRFTAGIGAVVPLTVLRAHGSPALGDYRAGRSDIDPVALIGTELTGAQREGARAVHRR